MYIIYLLKAIVVLEPICGVRTQAVCIKSLPSLVLFDMFGFISQKPTTKKNRKTPRWGK